MLTSDQLEVLEFERTWWLRPGPKDQMIEFDLGLTAQAYYEILLCVLDDTEAYDCDPLTIARLRASIEPTGRPEEAVV